MLRALFIKEKAGTSAPNGSSHPNGSKHPTRKNGTHVTATKVSSDDEEYMLGDLPKEGITRTVGTVVTTSYGPGQKDPEVTVQQTTSSGDSW